MFKKVTILQKKFEQSLKKSFYTNFQIFEKIN